jgi:cellulose synthase operon protein C
VGEEFARKLLDQTVPAYDGLPEAKEMAPLMEQATFLEKALFVAGHFGRVESIHPLVTRFQRMLQSTQGAMVFQVLEHVAKQCFRGLRKLGMRDEIDQILRQMAELVLKGRELKAIDFKKEEQGPAALRSLLQVAGQWACYGHESQARPIFQMARSVLLANDLPPRDQTQLACAYAAALGATPAEMAREGLEEIFRQVKGIKDTYTTSSHFHVSQLDVVESVVLAAVEVCSRR